MNVAAKANVPRRRTCHSIECGVTSIASMPAGQRARAEASFQGRNLTAFREVTLAWMRGTGMEPGTFADRFFGRSADDPVAQALRDAAKLAMTSTTPADMAAASGKVADAMQRVGLERWSRFLADAQTRARDPATEAAIKASIKAPDAIAPVYPEKYLLGARGAAGLLRAGVGALARQMMPESRPPLGRSPANGADMPGNIAEATATPTAIPLSRSRFGHTFEVHGQDVTEFLKNRAKAMGQPNGQFLDNQVAARFIQEDLSKTKNGPVSLPVPEGFQALIVNPDGTFSPARTLRLVPGGKSVKTAFPEP